MSISTHRACWQHRRMLKHGHAHPMATAAAGVPLAQSATSPPSIEADSGAGVDAARPLPPLPRPLSILLLMLRRICTLELRSSAASRLSKVHLSSCRHGPVVQGSRSRSPLRVLLDVCVGSPRICSRHRCQEINVLHAKIPRPLARHLQNHRLAVRFKLHR
jgi:hypothetical protein